MLENKNWKVEKSFVNFGVPIAFLLVSLFFAWSRPYILKSYELYSALGAIFLLNVLIKKIRIPKNYFVLKVIIDGSQLSIDRGNEMDELTLDQIDHFSEERVIYGVRPDTLVIYTQAEKHLIPLDFLYVTVVRHWLTLNGITQK